MHACVPVLGGDMVSMRGFDQVHCSTDNEPFNDVRASLATMPTNRRNLQLSQRHAESSPDHCSPCASRSGMRPIWSLALQGAAHGVWARTRRDSPMHGHALGIQGNDGRAIHISRQWLGCREGYAARHSIRSSILSYAGSEAYSVHYIHFARGIVDITSEPPSSSNPKRYSR